MSNNIIVDILVVVLFYLYIYKCTNTCETIPTLVTQNTPVAMNTRPSGSPNKGSLGTRLVPGLSRGQKVRKYSKQEKAECQRLQEPAWRCAHCPNLGQRGHRKKMIAMGHNPPTVIGSSVSIKKSIRKQTRK